MSDPFEMATIEAPACSTTFENPSSTSLVGANGVWATTGCNMTMEIPIGEKATITSDVVRRSLAASIGAPLGENVVISPTSYRIIGSHCCNPTGASIGLHINGTEKPHAHLGARGGEPAFYSAVLSNRYHPTGDFEVPITAARNDNESLEARVQIAQKWAGVKPDQLMTGVSQMVQKNEDGESVVTYAVPLVTAHGEPDEFGNQPMTQQPLAWCIERNRDALKDHISIHQLPTGARGIVADQFLVPKDIMENIISATHATVWGNHEADDITVSAEALGPVTGERTVTVGLRVEADVLSLTPG